MIARLTPAMDVSFLCNFILRSEDIAELEAATGMTAYAALAQSMRMSQELFYAEVIEGVLAVGGLHYQKGNGYAVPWMVASDLIGKYGVHIAKSCKRIIGRWRKEHALLVNAVDARNTVHIRWLKLLGFTFEDKPYNHNGYDFLKFYMQGETQCVMQEW